MAKKQNVLDQFKKDLNNPGSTQTQIAFLTEKIKNLTQHFNLHKKDFHSMRGLMKIVSRRKKLLSYIKRKNQEIH